MRRLPAEGMLSGVCAGVAEALALPPFLIRVAAVLGLLLAFTPVLVCYLAAWWLMETETRWDRWEWEEERVRSRERW
jgi:phage shock protein PspC (stress-responsive transcriptional regulator)